MKHLFLDESGSHNLHILDPDYPVFVLGGVMQLADLVVGPIARVVLGKRTHEDYKIIESKFRRSREGRIEGVGLVILPRERGRGPLRSSRP